jgi:hypothetical protein
MEATARTPQIRPSVYGLPYTRKMATGEGEKKAEAAYTPKYTGVHAQPTGSRRGQNGVRGGLVGSFRTPPIRHRPMGLFRFNIARPTLAYSEVLPQ